ncbi:MAG: Flp family type IVb pilin [Dethiobacteria bacterium]|mgnify:CR=1 FL=1|nr:Flp family type IVb pilin [Bacillota bacterium]HOP69733.1 Flp family type IVb pilin [Bacillota bacterium]HPT33609.1 Flp family type IVb pilin [Bacillota bacterium]HPZ64410.1 Flp family type IVb pilin [Bacillota bacterium]HQD06247.1 Flp family type IVb pilin [Bacillota bacterium]
MLRFLKKLIKDDSGQTMAEYALILAAIAIVVLGVIFLLGDEISAVFNKITGEMGEVVEE